MPKNLVSIIIVNWNGIEVLKNCLTSLSKLNYPHYEVIIVDNGSTDGSLDLVEAIKVKDKRYQLIKNSQNVGFAQANNQGFVVSRGKYILLLNNDTTVEKNFLNILVDSLEKDQSLGVAQPKIFIMDSTKLLDSVGSYITKIGFMQHLGYMAKDGKRFSKEIDIFSAKGACMLIRRAIIEKIGLFDESFGSYFEETDFCWRVWFLGFRIKFIPKSKIYHKVGFTSKRQDQVVVFFHSLKNQISTMIKNLEIKNLIFIGGIYIFLIVGLGFYYLVRIQPRKTLMVFRAIGWNLANLNLILQKRNRMQALRERSDKEIFKYILKPVNWSEMLSHFAKVEANF